MGTDKLTTDQLRIVQIEKFLAGFPEISAKEAKEIAPHIPVGAFAKGEALVKDGEVPKACYFVLKGLVRAYQLIDGMEKTTAFYTERSGVVSSGHYFNQTPQEGYLVCAEDCLLLVGNADLEQLNFAQFPVLKKVVSRMVEEELYATKEHFSQFVLSSPKERYLNLLEREPELIQRIPLHQIASYLGMTPESLSRIRKRLASRA